jgi:hypothetical protein
VKNGEKTQGLLALKVIRVELESGKGKKSHCEFNARGGFFSLTTIRWIPKTQFGRNKSWQHGRKGLKFHLGEGYNLGGNLLF